MHLRAAVINDLSGLGRCSLSADIAVLAAMGIEACPPPYLRPKRVMKAIARFPLRPTWKPIGATGMLSESNLPGFSQAILYPPKQPARQRNLLTRSTIPV